MMNNNLIKKIKYQQIIKNNYCTINDIEVENTSILFKKLFQDHFLVFENCSFLTSIFFKLCPNDYEKFSHNGTQGINLFYRLLINPYYKIQNQSDFDKTTSFFKANKVTFSLFSLLLAEVMNITININKTSSSDQIHFFSNIKQLIIEKMNNLKEVSSFSFDAKSKKFQKDYDVILTLNKMLKIMTELNALIIQQLLSTYLLRMPNPSHYIYNIMDVETFQWRMLKAENMPFAFQSKSEFLLSLNSLIKGKHIITSKNIGNTHKHKLEKIKNAIPEDIINKNKND